MEPAQLPKNSSRRFRLFKPAWLTMIILLTGAALIAGIVLPSHITKKRLEQVSRDGRVFRFDLTKYGMDRCGIYSPPDTSTRRARLEPNAPLTFEFDEKWITSQPVGFYNKPVTHWAPLTTPVAYAESVLRDPFNDGALIGYFTFTLHDHMPLIDVIHSVGPNGRADVDLPVLREQMFRYFSLRHPRSTELQKEDKGFIRELVTPYLYDPTNGLRSGGDLIMVIPWGDVPFGWTGMHSQSWAEFEAPLIVINEKDMNNPLRLVPGLWETTLELPLYLPVDFANALQSEGMSADNIDPLRNWLGRDFSDFFNEPRPLTDEEMAAWDSWVKQMPEFWRILGGETPSYKFEVSQDQFFNIMPVLGKCLLLKYAVDLNGERPYRASVGPSRISNVLNYNRPRCVEPLTLHQQRVFDELYRLGNAIESQSEILARAKQKERLGYDAGPQSGN